MRTIITASLIFLFWFVLSGHTEILLIVLGIASTGLTIYLSHRMKIIDNESFPYQLVPRLLRYSIYLTKQILLANIDVIKRILSPRNLVQPQLTDIPAAKNSDLSKAIYANSITLTPGTVTVELSGEKIKVHALSKSGIEYLKSGEMADKVPEPLAEQGG